MKAVKKDKRIRSFVLGGILLGLLAAGAVVWGIYYCGRIFRSGATASVDGTIYTDNQGAQAVLQTLFDSEPASVICGSSDGKTRIGLTFVGLSEEEEVNAEVIRLVKEHHLKATFALSANDAAEHPDTVRALLDAGGEIISNGIAGETALHRSTPEEMVNSMFKSRESISTGTGQRVSLLYCSGTALTSQVLQAARASGYQALVDWEKTHKETVTALIEVNVTPQRDKGFDRIAERIYQFDEVESVYLMSGSFDLTVIISGRTLKEVATFVSERLSIIEGVTGTATHFILKKYKEKHALFVKHEEQTDRIAFV